MAQETGSSFQAATIVTIPGIIPINACRAADVFAILDWMSRAFPEMEK